MRNSWFIALHDIWHLLRQGSTWVWLFLMPPVFFYFIGTVTGGFSGSTDSQSGDALYVEAPAPGFLRDQVDMRLAQTNFAPIWSDEADSPDSGEESAPFRELTLPDNFSDRILAGEEVTVEYRTEASALLRNSETVRIYRSMYTTLADIAVASEPDRPLSTQTLAELNEIPRFWALSVRPAGNRTEIPSGFDQAIPGIMVMFTLLILLTSSATALTLERQQGLLRRLAATPITRGEIVAGKWVARMMLATIQIVSAMLVGTFLFGMDWGPDLPAVFVVLLSWAAFCASAGLLLGSLADTEGQASGLGVLLSNAMAALGGCWWPIEITPGWMQSLQNFMPTGWAMDGLHRLVSFEAGPAAAVAPVLTLLIATAIVAFAAARRFRFT